MNGKVQNTSSSLRIKGNLVFWILMLRRQEWRFLSDDWHQLWGRDHDWPRVVEVNGGQNLGSGVKGRSRFGVNKTVFFSFRLHSLTSVEAFKRVISKKPSEQILPNKGVAWWNGRECVLSLPRQIKSYLFAKKSKNDHWPDLDYPRLLLACLWSVVRKAWPREATTSLQDGSGLVRDRYCLVWIDSSARRVSQSFRRRLFNGAETRHTSMSCNDFYL